LKSGNKERKTADLFLKKFNYFHIFNCQPNGLDCSHAIVNKEEKFFFFQFVANFAGLSRSN